MDEKLFSLVLNNRFVLVSGKAGTGKSFLLRKLELMLKPYMKVVVAAPTGVAAVNIGGTTLHSWLSLGLASEPVEVLKKKMSGRTRCTLAETNVLLIDEISMVDPTFFQKISKLVAYVHNTPNLPFGRMKLVMFGDFLQLPPITVSSERYVFNTELWTRMNVHRLRLSHVFRQSDGVFLNLLNNVRTNQLSDEDEELLKTRINQQPPKPYTRLCTFRKQVQLFNTRELDAIQDTPLCTFEGMFKIETRENHQQPAEQDVRAAKSIMFKSSKFPVAKTLNLKIGAQVMMRCNVFLEDYGICNGSIGIVLAITSDAVTVQFAREVIDVTRYKFVFRVGRTVDLNLFQFPLSLSWAMTIHKSQGLTIDRILVDTDCFETGQMYTALSRVKEPHGLFLTGFHKKGVKVDPRALEFESV